jgi:hypothetical protein
LAQVSVSFPAEALRLEGEHYKPSVPVVWDQPATNLPSSIMVYKVVPQQLSEEIFSNLLTLGSFTTKTMKLSADKKTMSWRRYEGEGARLNYSLDIAPVYGFIEYHDYVVTRNWTNTPHGVPSRQEVEKLALDYLQRLGGDTNQLSFRRHSGTEGTRSRYDKTAKKYTGESVYKRGTMYARQIDGIRFAGEGWRGLAIDFSNDAKISSLELNWRNLQPLERRRTATKGELLSWIRDGRGVIPLTQNANLDELAQAKKLTVTGITPYYLSTTAGTPQGLMYPFAELDMVADLAGTNTLAFQIDCPILTDEKAQ